MKKIIVLAALALSSLGFGKGYVQEWTPKLPAWESVVFSCDTPKPYRLIAADDFYIEDQLPIRQINWWGVVSGADQLKRAYYIAIYKDGEHCQPAWDSIIWSNCTRAKTEFVGGDCQGNRVWKFYSAVPLLNPLTLGPGRYWIQISESDRHSVNPDRPDFWWSSHQDVVKCPALQMDSAGNILQALMDPCNDRPDDLAFEILA